jgi:hypothetical protein
MTRAIEAIWGFLPAAPGPNNRIASLIQEALKSDLVVAGGPGIRLSEFYDSEKGIFEFGHFSSVDATEAEIPDSLTGNYRVSSLPHSLNLRLHGENYFAREGEETRRKISYGNLMHGIFSEIDTKDDIPAAVNRLVSEGKISQAESSSLVSEIGSLISEPEVSGWFRPGVNILKETGILIPSGSVVRPDRVMAFGDNAVIVDFKFGEEHPSHSAQIGNYRDLLLRMGYGKIDAYLWYVTRKKVIKV